MTVPLAVIGMDFREGPSSVRAMLKAIDEADDSPSALLRRGGDATGIVRIESCSRIEWVISASNPTWAAELLRGALLSRLGAAGAGRAMHAKVSRGAVSYLVRVAFGLESVAEGEHAIGRQVIKAFEAGHALRSTDRTLNLCWHALGRMLQLRRETGASASVGVQSLVLQELRSLSREAAVLVLGIGDIGGQVLAALRRDGFIGASGFGRADQERFTAEAKRATAVVVCSGAPKAHLQLPPRGERVLGGDPLAVVGLPNDANGDQGSSFASLRTNGVGSADDTAPIVIDLGSPAQVVSAPGWARIDLDTLLARRGLTLESDSMAALQLLADQGAEALEEALDDAAQHHVLEAIESERKRFFEDDIDALVATLPPKEARRITAQLRGFTHRLLEATRRAGRAP